MRRDFRVKWSAFLRAHFQSAVHVAVFFSVTDRTARNWLDQICEPHAFAVAQAEASFPGTVHYLLAVAA